MSTIYIECEIQQVKEKEWDGVRRKYWFGRETYYLPIITWNKSKLLENLQEKEVIDADRMLVPNNAHTVKSTTSSSSDQHSHEGPKTKKPKIEK